MKLAQHLFALTRPEQRVVVLIVFGLLFSAAFSHYRKAETMMPQPVSVHTESGSKPPVDENSEED